METQQGEVELVSSRLSEKPCKDTVQADLKIHLTSSSGA